MSNDHVIRLYTGEKAHADIAVSPRMKGILERAAQLVYGAETMRPR